VLVQVQAYVIDPEVGKSELTNVFNFTFQCPYEKDTEIKKVMPRTYAEAMKYLEGKRLLDGRGLQLIDSELQEMATAQHNPNTKA
jgi:acyl-coenzyme A thioesterase 9